MYSFAMSYSLPNGGAGFQHTRATSLEEASTILLSLTPEALNIKCISSTEKDGAFKHLPKPAQELVPDDLIDALRARRLAHKV